MNPVLEDTYLYCRMNASNVSTSGIVECDNCVREQS